jgi:hypothetical protein
MVRTCALKAKCTEGHERRIARWEHEAVVEAVQKRLDENPDAMRTRRETVEHPFGNHIVGASEQRSRDRLCGLQISQRRFDIASLRRARARPSR